MATNEDRINVLLVEDNPSDAQLLCELLQGYPPQRFAIEHAERLEEAVKLVAERTFDVVLLDLTLPDSAGLDTCARMRRAAPHVPIVVLTGVDDETVALEAMQQGVEDYLVKGEIIHGGTIGRATRYAVERRRSARALEEHERRLRLALEGAQLGCWEWDVQADTIVWDERMRELLRVGELTPATSELFFRLVSRQDQDGLRETLRKSRETGENFQAEFRVIRPVGQIAWLVLRGTVVRDESTRAVRLLGVAYDVTERHQMEDRLLELNQGLEDEVAVRTEQLTTTVDQLRAEVMQRTVLEEVLRERSQMLDAFFQHTITPLAFLDRSFSLVRVNDAYAKAAGAAAETLTGRNYFDLYPDDDTRAIFLQAVQTGQPYRAHARPFNFARLPSPAVAYWNWWLTPLLDAAGQVQFLVLNLEDVTEGHRAFSELEHRTRQLQRLTLELSQAEDRERKRLAEVLHDDLQQILTASTFHLHILRTRLKNNKALGDIAAHIHQLLKEAIDTSRGLSHELSPVVLYRNDLGTTFEWLAQEVQAKHGLTVQVEVRDHVDSASEAHKVFLFRAAQEILFNIVKHAHVKEARVRLQRLRGQLWLTINDRGRGFDPKSLDKTAGFGLLSIRERVELLGGRMKIWSAKGRGSTFLIAVPDAVAAEAPAVEAEQQVPREVAAPEPAKRAGARTLRILLVDDHQVVREGLAVLLAEQQDMEIVGQAGDGQEAVDLASTLEPDVIVMDATMPGMGGDEATRRIKRSQPKTRIVALSMFEEAQMSEMMRKAGAEVYLVKTAPSEQLLAAIRGR